MKTVQSQELLALFLPKGILEHFDIASYDTGSIIKMGYDKTLELTLEEKTLFHLNTGTYPISLVGLWKPATSTIILSVTCLLS